MQFLLSSAGKRMPKQGAKLISALKRKRATKNLLMETCTGRNKSVNSMGRYGLT